MTELEILSILKSNLGEYYNRGNQYSFYCINCNHYKRKLEINLDTYNYHCWVCNIGGKNFYYLLKKYCKLDSDTLLKVSEYTKVNRKVYNKENIEYNLTIPKEYISLLSNNNSLDYKKVINFLKNRNILEDDIKRYNIGYCEIDNGEYGGRIIIPSYNREGILNYFVARTYFNHSMKYKNPKISKNIVGFEFFVDYNYPIVLVEGALDAISIRRNAIPLFGKVLSENLKLRIIENNVKNIYICLDNDAKKDATKIANELIKLNSDINVYIVDLEDKDPSEIGFDRINDIIYSSKRFSFDNLIYRRLFE